jgi:hypothetical protein
MKDLVEIHSGDFSDEGSKERLRAVLEQHGTKVISGHGVYTRLSWLVPPEQTIVFFRNPVDRVLSHHAAHLRKMVKESSPANLSLLEWAQAPENCNLMTQLSEGLDLAKAFIGITEEYEESLQRLNARFGLDLKMRHDHRNPKKKYEIDSATREKLLDLNQRDVALYELAKTYVHY